MDKIMNLGIKTVIERYPAVGEVLNEYGIACVGCAVGTCLFKDILNIHHLSAAAEQELMQKIADIVSPGEVAKVPVMEPSQKKQQKKHSYSPPIKRLVEEHDVIKRLLRLIPVMVEKIDVRTEDGRGTVLAAVDFIRNFADRFHHAKEEDILFKIREEPLDVIDVMLQEHDIGRGHVKAVVEAVERGDNAGVKNQLLAYRALLEDHIKKEDEVLYPWLDRDLSDSQIGSLYSEFAEVDKQMQDQSTRCREIVDSLERKFGSSANGVKLR